jgi:hypothetical protein
MLGAPDTHDPDFKAVGVGMVPSQRPFAYVQLTHNEALSPINGINRPGSFGVAICMNPVSAASA